MEQIESEFAVKLKTDEAATALEGLFKAYYTPLCSYACYFLKDKDESEEIVQGIFYQLWEKRRSIVISVSIKSYLFTAVRNNSLKRINHMKIKNEYRENVINSSEKSADNTTDKVVSKELEAQIEVAIDGLPEQCGIVFKLSRHGELKYSEIAEHLEISVKTVEKQMGKALRILREKLKAYLLILVYFLISTLNG